MSVTVLDGEAVASFQLQLCRTCSITPADLMQVPRRVGAAGGVSKYRAIRAALRGAWVNVLVTDLDTGRALVEDTEVRLADLLPAEVLG
jgi:DNA-binding transcriptional regulator LsrR (DeoR family)